MVATYAAREVFRNDTRIFIAGGDRSTPVAHREYRQPFAIGPPTTARL
ncbi:MAG TPA: hypothetical protein VGE27_11660 [Gemmatimonas sp.]